MSCILLPTTPITVETPCGLSEGLCTTRDVVIVLSGDLGLLTTTIFRSLENARVGFIGLRRDEETAQAERYMLTYHTSMIMNGL